MGVAEIAAQREREAQRASEECHRASVRTTGKSHVLTSRDLSGATDS